VFSGFGVSDVSNKLLAITIGDVAGIGPEVIVRSLRSQQFPHAAVPVLIGPPEVFQHAARLVGCPLNLCLTEVAELTSDVFRQTVLENWKTGTVTVCNPAGPAAIPAPLCKVSAAAGDAAFRCLSLAIQLTSAGSTDAIVTAPLNKESLHLAGHHYPGHTEILAEQCGVRDFAMMLHLPETALRPLRQLLLRSPASPGPETDSGGHGLSIAHVTLHTSVASVSGLLSVESIEEKVHLMDGFLCRAGCSRRSIAVCALNPHGGEHGLFGHEESQIIEPAVARCRGSVNVHGPLPVDTLIRRAVLGEFDGVVAMYHDQGHIPVKLIGFDAAINITLGLPLIRTSPTHGTAFDRAWNESTPSSEAGMLEAIRMAYSLAQTRNN
jgi:4-hydroxythreonine-4-phosphate dehydrogenase